MTEILALFFAGGLILIDQLTKFFIKSSFYLNQSEPVIEGVLNFTYIHNPGAVGGILSGHPWVFNTITLVVIACGIWLFVTHSLKSKLLIWSAALIISGGIGNMIDRLTLGYVVDFVDVQFIRFFVFNIADSCVVIGSGLMILHFLIDTVRETKKHKADKVTNDGTH